MLKAGVTSQSVTIKIIDSTDGTPETGVTDATAGLSLAYRRTLSASVAITPASLAALTTAWTSGGIKHIGNGYYRLDVPDAAFASGAGSVLIHGTVTGMVVIGVFIQLVAFDPFDAVRMGMTALPNVSSGSAGAIPTTGTGANQIDVSGGDVVLTSAAVTTIVNAMIAAAFDKGDGLFDPATDSLQAIRDRGDAAWAATAAMLSGTAQAFVSSTTIKLAASAHANDDFYNRAGIVITTSPGVLQERLIIDYNGTTKIATVDEAWSVNPDTSTTYEIGPARTSARETVLAAGAIVAGTFANDSITAAAIAANAIGTSEFAAALITAIQAGLATSAAQTTLASAVAAVQADTDDLQTRIPTVLSNGFIKASVQEMATDVITAGAIQADAIGSAELATTAVNEIAAAVWDTTIAEPTGPFSWASAKARDIQGWLGARARNRQTQTATTQTLRNDANSADIGTSTVADDGTTGTKGKWA